ncbi:MAG: hypothetical protein AB1445_01795 [Bacillota bacterium]
MPFYSEQVRVALSGCGHLDPEDLEDALGHGGYHALARYLLEMTPEDVIAEIATSGLRAGVAADSPPVPSGDWHVPAQEKPSI